MSLSGQASKQSAPLLLSLRKGAVADDIQRKPGQLV